jgi:hypothetical protein
MDKPKHSTIGQMSLEDLAAVNKLVVMCGDYYYRIAHPSKPGPHTNPSEVEDLRHEMIRQCLKVGERMWYPRGKSRLTILKDKLDNDISKRKNGHK